MDTSTLLAGVLFGGIGMGYLVYGKKQHHAVALFVGFALCGLPYLISNVLLMTLLCLACMALPFFYRC